MEEIKSYEELSKIGIESEIVDINAQIFDLEQRMSEDGLGSDELAFLGQELSGMYDSLERYTAMLDQFEDKTPVDEFKEYMEAKQQAKEPVVKDVKDSDYMGR